MATWDDIYKQLGLGTINQQIAQASSPTSGGTAPAASAPARTVSRPSTWEGFNSSVPQGGHSEADILAAAIAYGQPRNLAPVYLKDNGQYLNGGYQIKFRDNNLGGVSTTEFVPMAGFQGYGFGDGGGGSGGGGGGGGGGGAFDPILNQFRQDMQAGSIADLASRDAAIKRALGLFGEVPDFGAAQSFLGFDPTPLADAQTQQIAAQNTAAGTSTKARIEKAHKDAIRQIRNVLAARGALRSGELGHQLSEEQGAYTKAQFDAREALTELLAGYQRGYLEGERQRQMALFQAMMGAAGRGGGGASGAGTAGAASTVAPGAFGVDPRMTIGGYEGEIPYEDWADRVRAQLGQGPYAQPDDVAGQRAGGIRF